MNKLCDDLNFCIIEFLDNESVFNISYLNKYYNRLVTQQDFIEYLQYREHPIVFNIIDNLCTKCNIGIIIINDHSDISIMRCNHLP